VIVKNREAKDAGPRYAYNGLDRVIHERARLSVLTSLATHPQGLSFSEVKRFCALTDGNLNRHLQVLEEATLISISKDTDYNRSLTCCRLTASGRRRFLDYLAVLEQVLADAAVVIDVELKEPSTSELQTMTRNGPSVA
jgi:DNA-binding MarR family transcriptional regulator